MQKTEYRAISDGDVNWLQYKSTRIRGWWIFKFKRTRWLFVRSSSYDMWDVRKESLRDEYFPCSWADHYIHDRDYDLNKFIQNNPDVVQWESRITKKVQEEFRKFRIEENNKANKRGRVTNLNT